MVLADQHTAMLSEAAPRRETVSDSLGFIKDLGYRIRDAWTAGDLDGWGRMLDEHWTQKKKLSGKISWSAVDDLYDHVKRDMGVTGGKVIGAGGGGFLMLFQPGDGAELETYMASQNMPRLRYGIDRTGSCQMAETPL